MSILPSMEGGVRLRWLLLVSLTLNLFFMGAAGAVALRYTGPAPLATIARIDHSWASRLDRIATSLPPADSQIIRRELHNDAEKVATAQADLRLSQEDVRKSLRAEPFDPVAVRLAMAENRTARDNFDRLVHDMIAAAADQMSVVGRNKLADWPAERAEVRPLRQNSSF
jgi:uncharacterized membrane protein